MQALITTPGQAGSARVASIPDVRATGTQLLLRTLHVGVCGTDREIVAGEFGQPPPGGEDLVLGHEFVGVVQDGGGGFAAGDVVTGTVRRSCGACAACEGGAPDACDTGRYTERGITALHGFASDLVVERPEHLVAVPAGLDRLAVLAEPTSVCMRGIRQALAVGGRQPWEPRRALVIGAGAIGMLATYALRLAGHDVWTAARQGPASEQALLVATAGARYVPTGETSLAALGEDTGGFDLVVEATGDAEVMLGVLGLLRRNGVGCLLGIDGRPRRVAIDGRVIGVDAVIENRAIFGSVNAHPTDWRAAVDGLGALHRRWPDALERMIGCTVAPDRFDDAFAFRGVKATLDFGG